MLPPAPTDHRRSDERRLLLALRGGDALALAEAYHRTIAGAHACARRLLSDRGEVESLLTVVYEELWRSGPEVDESPEGWVRRRCFALATAHLQQEGCAVASPSTAALLPDLPKPQVRHLDAAERALAELPERNRLALLRAHDAGVPAGQQRAWAIVDVDSAASPREALTAALLQLAQSDGSDDTDSAALEQCGEPRLADWVLGLLDVAEAAAVTTAVEQRPECAAAARVLRRGRRRLEGLPPTPDMGERIIAAVLSRNPVSASVESRSAVGPQQLPTDTGGADTGETDTGGADTGQADVEETDTEDLTGVAQAVATGQVPDTPEAGSIDEGGDPGDPDGDMAATPGATVVHSSDEPDAEVPGQARSEVGPGGTGTAGRVARTILGLLLLLVGAAIGLYAGRLIIAAL